MTKYKVPVVDVVEHHMYYTVEANTPQEAYDKVTNKEGILDKAPQYKFGIGKIPHNVLVSSFPSLEGIVEVHDPTITNGG